MGQFKAKFYKLTEDELQKMDFRKGFFKRNPDAHPSRYYQTINLDRRTPSFSEDLVKDTLDLNRVSIDGHLANHIFVIDITSVKNKLLSRYLLVSEKDFGIQDSLHSSYKISGHIGFLCPIPVMKSGFILLMTLLISFRKPRDLNSTL